MKILLIDNLSKHTEKIFPMLSEQEIVVKKYNEIPESTEQYDAIVLSGGSQLPAVHDVFLAERKLISQTTKPLLGICLGFELLCLEHEGSIQRHDEQFRGMETISVKKNRLFENLPESIEVYQAHRWNINSVELEVLSENERCVQAVRDRRKPHWGVQFHPECSGEIGKKILNNFLKQVKKLRNKKINEQDRRLQEDLYTD